MIGLTILITFTILLILFTIFIIIKCCIGAYKCKAYKELSMIIGISLTTIIIITAIILTTLGI